MVNLIVRRPNGSEFLVTMPTLEQAYAKAFKYAEPYGRSRVHCTIRIPKSDAEIKAAQRGHWTYNSILASGGSKSGPVM